MFCHKAIFCYAFPSTSFRINYHISLPPPPPPPFFQNGWIATSQTPSNNAEPEGWFGSWILTSSPLHMAKTQRVKHKWPPWTDNIMITAWSSMTSGSTKHDHLFMAGNPSLQWMPVFQHWSSVHLPILRGPTMGAYENSMLQEQYTHGCLQVNTAKRNASDCNHHKGNLSTIFFSHQHTRHAHCTIYYIDYRNETHV